MIPKSKVRVVNDKNYREWESGNFDRMKNICTPSADTDELAAIACRLLEV